MFRKYICYFKQAAKQRTLIFNIDPNPVSELWCSLISENPPHSIQTVFPRNRNFMLEKYRKLYECLDVIGLHDFPRDPDKINRENLNQLHKQFHFYEEAHQDEVGRHRKAYQDLNYMIHSIETMLAESSNTQYAVWASEPYSHSIPIDNSIRPYWSTKTLVRPPGSLYLGYATIGKNLRHVYMDNDVQLVLEDGIRPQQAITSEVLLFCDSARMLDSNVQNILIQRWAKNNNLKINFEDPAIKNCNLPFLGQATVTSQELEDLFVNYEFVKVSLE